MKEKLVQKIPEISIISAISDNNIIGLNGEIPWNIPEDMRYFKTLTNGNTVIMGRNTYESIGKPLPNRINIIVSSKMSSNTNTYRNGIICVDNLEKAIKLASIFERKIFLIGGYEIYREGLLYADNLYITKVHKVINYSAKSDKITMFPGFTDDEWKVKSSKFGDDCRSIGLDYTFYLYSRKKKIKKFLFFK